MPKLHSRSQLREVAVEVWKIVEYKGGPSRWEDTKVRLRGWFHGFYNAGSSEDFGPEMMVEFEDGSLQLVLGTRVKFVGTGDE